jgi:hypothetical protein
MSVENQIHCLILFKKINCSCPISWKGQLWNQFGKCDLHNLKFKICCVFALSSFSYKIGRHVCFCISKQACGKERTIVWSTATNASPGPPLQNGKAGGWETRHAHAIHSGDNLACTNVCITSQTFKKPGAEPDRITGRKRQIHWYLVFSAPLSVVNGKTRQKKKSGTEELNNTIHLHLRNI